jgi:dipeptidyl aminopeptidase/acylaminoacyl peptidase
MLRATLIVVPLTLAALPLHAQVPVRRPLQAADIYRLRDVRDPQLAPDGKWVAYVVSEVDSAKDRNVSHVWMTSWDGAHTIQATSSTESERAPRWSPDGRYLSFLSSRGGAEAPQLWLLDRMGGEAVRVTNIEQGISEYDWAPDGKRLVFVISDRDSVRASGDKSPKPIVVTRYRFKSDGAGYLDGRRSHLYLFDLESRSLEQLTTGVFDEESPAWSPDGRWIAFVSNRSTDPDRTNNRDVFVIEAKRGATARQLTTFAGPDDGPLSWSPDSRTIAYVQGSDPKYRAYNLRRLATVPVEGGAPRVLTEALDRSVSSPTWTVDGSHILVSVTDDRTRYLARVDARSGKVERIVDGSRVITSITRDDSGSVAVLVTTATRPPEVFAVEGSELRQLSRQNDAWLAEVQLATTEGISTRGRDGTVVNGLLVKPASYTPGQRYPAILWIHGGPNLQDQYEFRFERELFAANGYVVFTANYRGSAGRGEKFGTSIFADWGNKEVQDLLAMTGHVVALGIADPDRLGIGGWSYGGILTNYTIATDRRFKAAASGAGSSLQLSMYGTDQYIAQYEIELGSPWKNRDLWLKVSYPFFRADRITTPTQFMSGDRDFNVPLIGSEQMYQALRSLGVDTELIIYPGQYHLISRPTFKRDRFERYVAWFDKYLGAGETVGGG